LLSELLNDAIAEAKQERLGRNGRYKIIEGWFLGHTAASLTSGEISAKLASQRVVVDGVSRPLAASSYNRHRVALSHAYKLGMQNKKVAENPARLVKMHKLNNERVFPRTGRRSPAPSREPGEQLARAGG
jgi:hypothetical protein